MNKRHKLTSSTLDSETGTQMGVKGAVDLARVTLATARLTRLITTDWLGEWMLVRRVKAWAMEAEVKELARRTARMAEEDFESLERAVEGLTKAGRRDLTIESLANERLLKEYAPDDPFTWQAKLAHGLDCPFCVGFWIGAGVLGAEALTKRGPFRVLRPLWLLTSAALTLNYVTGHLAKRIDK